MGRIEARKTRDHDRKERSPIVHQIVPVTVGEDANPESTKKKSTAR